MPLTREVLVEYLETKQGVDASQLEDDGAELFSSGLLDSFSIVDLVMFIETEGGIKVGPTEVNLDNLDTVGAILAFVTAKES